MSTGKKTGLSLEISGVFLNSGECCDQTLTQSLLTKYINTLSSSTATKTDQTYQWNAGTMSHFTGSRHTPNPEVYSGEAEEPRPSTVTHYYVNFTEAVNVNFDQARSAASAAGVDPRSVGNGITLMDDETYATNITFGPGGEAYAEASMLLARTSASWT